MEIVGAIFQDEETLTPVLDALQDAGFDTFMVFGPDDFSGEPGLDDDAESSTQKHTAAGTISGISVNPPAGNPDDQPSTETIEDELMAVGLPRTDARMFVGALEQDRLLLLVQTWTGRTETVEELLEAHDAQMLRRIHPDDAFPEELWRNVEPRHDRS